MQWPDEPENGSPPIHELIGLIYDTAEDPALWPLLLAGLVESVREAPPTPDGEGDDAPPSPASAIPGTPDLQQLPLLAGDALSETLIPHFQRALRLNRLLAETRQDRERAMGILEHLPLGVMVVDESACVQAMNDRARRILDRQAGLRLQAERLATSHFQDTVALRDLIRTAVIRADGGGTLNLDGEPPVSLMVMPCGAEAEGEAIDGCCTVFIAAPDLDEHIQIETLREVFNLSRAEARLAHALVHGRSVEAAARELHISPHTARTQLKAIFAKTGTRRQPELVRKVLTSPAILIREPAPASDDSSPLPAVSDHFLHLAGDRRLCYAEHGDPDGVPVLFFHSIVGSRLQIHPDRRLVSGMGIRWIVPERPGFGRSDPQPRRRLADWADDMMRLADHLRLDRFHLAGLSAGGSHAVAVAHYRPERVIRTALISPMPPFSSLAALEGMPPTNRMLLTLARYTPGLLGPFMRIMLQGLLRNPEQITARHRELWPQADRDAMDVPGTREYTVGIFREAMRQGPDALVSEQILLARDWGFDPADVRGPVDIWHGDADIHVPINMIGPLRRIPDHRLHVVPEHGHYLVLSHWQTIFDTLVAEAA